MKFTTLRESRGLFISLFCILIAFFIGMILHWNTKAEERYNQTPEAKRVKMWEKEMRGIPTGTVVEVRSGRLFVIRSIEKEASVDDDPSLTYISMMTGRTHTSCRELAKITFKIYRPGEEGWLEKIKMFVQCKDFLPEQKNN